MKYDEKRLLCFFVFQRTFVEPLKRLRRTPGDPLNPA